ncbi:Retrovirus-related Pol polyprotein from type-2 retrotransposable element R2DM, partial [Araneus ventricosus]
KTRAREQRKQCCLAWLDVSNAFGAVPHTAIHQALSAAKVGSAFQELVHDLYTDSTTQILCNNDKTEEINILSGVKQGCPLSGILFNLSIDPTIRRIQGSAEDHKILAFADDVCLLADSPAELQAQLNKVSEDLKRISLSLNPRKSFAFHLACNTPVGTRDSDFFLDNERLQTIQEFDSHKFLGVPVGYNPVSDLNNLSEIAELGIRLATSLLAPWQRIDALKCFFYPAMQFAMRTAQYEKKHFDAIDNAIRKEIKKILYLPVTASNKFIYGSRKMGCLAIPIAAEESDLNRIDTAFKLLSSRDDLTREKALKQLKDTVRFRGRRFPTDEDIGKFLSGEHLDEFLPRSNRFSSIWNMALESSRRLKVSWSFDNDSARIHFQDLEPIPDEEL